MYPCHFHIPLYKPPYLISFINDTYLTGRVRYIFKVFHTISYLCKRKCLNKGNKKILRKWKWPPAIAKQTYLTKGDITYLQDKNDSNFHGKAVFLKT